MVHADTSRTGLPVGNSGRSQPKKKRAYHNKVRTGCKTCKIRRIRCDEGKPSCKRCLTTGRKCDGYGTGPSYPMPSSSAEDEVYLSNYLDLGADLALGGMVKCPEELRSYRFFMEVTASSLAGALQTDFWLLEVPRVCHYDKAIWHATVSLGSSHEAYVSGRPSSNKTNPFSLKHFNLAIGALMKNGSASEWWRALTVSTIFTCICVLEGQLEQSRLHFKSGCKLLRSLEAAMLQPMKESDGTEAAVVLAGSQMPSSPVSLSSVRSMLICFELVEAKMDPKLTSTPPSLLSDNDKYCAWRSYSVPWSSAFGRFLTSRNLSDAILSAESLFMALAIASFGHAKAVKERYAKEGFNNFHIDDVDETGHHRSFKEIQKALDLFRAELEGTPGPSMRPAELLELKKAYLSLRVIHSASRLFLVEDPDEPDPKRRIASLPDLCTSIVDLAEKVFGLETTVGCLRSGGPVSSPTIMNPLVAVVKCGVGSATRERAIRLLYMPRLEGVWDSRMAACIGERILTRERTATIEYSQQEEMNSITINNPLARGWNKEDGHDDDIHPLARTCNSSMMYVSGQEMRFIARTWKEWLEDKQGEETRIFW